jgi:hypothetical protein
MSERRHVAAEVADLIWADSPSGKRVLRCARLRRAPLRMTTGWALWSKKEEISVEVELPGTNHLPGLPTSGYTRLVLNPASFFCFKERASLSS